MGSLAKIIEGRGNLWAGPLHWSGLSGEGDVRWTLEKKKDQQRNISKQMKWGSTEVSKGHSPKSSQAKAVISILAVHQNHLESLKNRKSQSYGAGLRHGHLFQVVPMCSQC